MTGRNYCDFTEDFPDICSQTLTPPILRPDSALRDIQIADLIEDGLRGPEIAKLFGLTRQRIWQISKRLGLNFHPHKVEVPCATCKKPVLVFRSTSRIRKHIFCSLTCSARFRGVPEPNASCHVCNKAMVLSPSKLKGQKRFFCSRKCYHSLRQDGRYHPNRQGQRIARKVVSQYFDLQPQHVVHHEDRDTRHNDIVNLLVFASQADHMAYHHGSDVKPLWDGRMFSQGVTL